MEHYTALADTLAGALSSVQPFHKRSSERSLQFYCYCDDETESVLVLMQIARSESELSPAK